MLGLKLPTDPRWVNIVEKNIDEGSEVDYEENNSNSS